MRTRTAIFLALFLPAAGFAPPAPARSAASPASEHGRPPLLTALRVASPTSEDQRLEQEYNLNVGAAIDTLRSDIPSLLSKPPDLAPFAENVVIHDPHGQKLSGKQQYSQMFRVLRGMSTIVLQESSTVQARFFFDKSRSTLRSKVSAKLWVHGMAKSAEPMHLDVVSTYEFDHRGIVTKHTVDRVDVDGTRTEAFQFMHADRAQMRNWLSGAPALRPMPTTGEGGGRWLLPRSAGAGETRVSPPEARTPGLTFKAEEQKFDVYGNIIPPSMQNNNKEGTGAKMAAEEKKKGFWDFIKQFEPETCEDDFDCPSNEHCCDFVVAKTCCSGGIGVSDGVPQRAMQLIPSRINDGYGPQDNDGSGYPPGSGPGSSPW